MNQEMENFVCLMLCDVIESYAFLPGLYSFSHSLFQIFMSSTCLNLCSAVQQINDSFLEKQLMFNEIYSKKIKTFQTDFNFKFN